jgi:ribosomal protein S18 acetylase RimI-like enzyme
MSGDGFEIIIRPATLADMPAVGRLGALLVRLHHEFDAGYASFLGSQLMETDVILLVADRGGEAVGYAYAGIEGFDYMSLRGPAGVLYDIVVDSSRRGQGIGQKLLNAMFTTLGARGAPRVVLFTAERNEAAQRLFARVGFRRTMIEMTRELGPED